MTPPERLNTFRNVYDVRDTRNSPVLVMCEDTEDYVVKHTRGQTPCNRIAVEIIAAYFLELWSLPTPIPALVNVNLEHLKDFLGTMVQPAFFGLPCVGSQYHKDAKEFNKFYQELTYNEKRRFDPVEFLKLALFDVWMANTDRNVNNPNFLIEARGGSFHVLPIDHESCFDGSDFNADEMYELTEYDSILQDPAVQQIVKTTTRDNEKLNQIVEDAYICIGKCEENVDEILSYLPEEWQVDVNKVKQFMLDKLFSDAWKARVKNIFFEHIQSFTH